MSNRGYERVKEIFKQAGVTLTKPELDRLMEMRRDKKMSARDIITEVRNDPDTFTSYHARFPNIVQLLNDGKIRGEREYRLQESAYRKVMIDYGIAADSPLLSSKNMSQLMLNEVSPVEVEDRVATASNLLASTGGEGGYFSKALEEYYGITRDLQLAFVLDPDSTTPLIDKRAQEVMRGATLGARAAQYGINLSNAELYRLAADTSSRYDGYTGQQVDADVSRAMQTAGQLAQQDSFLAGVDRESYDTADAAFAAMGNQQKVMESERRKQREKDRFSGTSGVGSGSLSQARNM